MNEVILNALNFVKDFFSNDFSGHDYDHTIRVYKMALELSSYYDVDEFVVSLAALLHDVDDRKISVSTNKNKANAVGFMKQNKINEKTINDVIKIIDEVSFKGNDTVIPSTLEGKIVQDADRLDAIGAIGIARTFAYGGSRGRKMYDPKDLPNLNMNEEEYFKHVSTTINHFYEKLLLLKDMMNTEAAKEIALKRHQFMQNYLEEFYAEWDGKR